MTEQTGLMAVFLLMAFVGIGFVFAEVQKYRRDWESQSNELKNDVRKCIEKERKDILDRISYLESQIGKHFIKDMNPPMYKKGDLVKWQTDPMKSTAYTLAEIIHHKVVLNGVNPHYTYLLLLGEEIIEKPESVIEHGKGHPFYEQIKQSTKPTKTKTKKNVNSNS